MNKKLCILSTSIITFSCVSNSTINNNPLPSPTQIIKPSIKPSPSKEPTATPSPSTTSLPSTPIENNVTPDISSNATLTGRVYNQDGVFLDDATVTVEYDNIKQETKSIKGSYVFRDLPTGKPILVTSYKDDEYPSKTQSIVLKSNLTGNTNLNNLDFGDQFQDTSPSKQNFFFLTNAPEVNEIYVNNTKNYTTRHFNFSIKMIFNKLVEKKSVIDNLYIRSLKERVGPSVLIGDGKGNTSITDNFEYKCIVDSFTSGIIFRWDTNDYNEYGKELTINFTKNAALVTSIDKNIFYGLTLRSNNGSIFLTSKDRKQALESGDFYINNERRKNFVFSVIADKTEPELEKIEVDNKNGKKQIRLLFSEPMSFIGSSSFNSELLNINNYIFYRNNNAFVPVSPTLKMIDASLLEIEMDNSSFSEGDTIKVEVKPNLKDPAGNFFSRGQKNGEWNYIKSDSL